MLCATLAVLRTSGSMLDATSLILSFVYGEIRAFRRSRDETEDEIMCGKRQFAAQFARVRTMSGKLVAMSGRPTFFED
jgi:hypothetical protein